MDKSEKKTIVEEGTSFKGTLASSCAIDVRGKIEGEIETPSLTVSKSGAVHGRAKVGSVRSEGELSGEFDADSVELAGRVLDNTIIRARSFEVKLSVQRGKMQAIFGQCELAIGDEPTEHVAVDVPVAAPVEAVPVEAAPAMIPATTEEPAMSIPLPAPYVPEPENPMLPPPLPILDVAPAEPLPEPLPADVMPVPAAEPIPAPAPTVAAGTLDEVLAELDVVAAPAAEAKGEGKKKNKKKDEKNWNGEVAASGWSQPPSQPPPAS